MHAYDNARHCDQRCHRQQARLTLRIKTTHGNCNSKRSHGVTGGKGKAVWRRNDGPAVRLDLTGAPAPAERLHTLKDQDGHERREGAGKESTVAVLSAADEYKDAERIPEPAVAQAAHDQHKNAYGQAARASDADGASIAGRAARYNPTRPWLRPCANLRRPAGQRFQRLSARSLRGIDARAPAARE